MDERLKNIDNEVINSISGEFAKKWNIIPVLRGCDYIDAVGVGDIYDDNNNLKFSYLLMAISCKYNLSLRNLHVVSQEDFKEAFDKYYNTEENESYEYFNTDFNKILSNETLTYDDVSIVPQYSDVKTRNNIKIKTKISKDFEIKTPIVASPMDSVVGKEMIIEMAKLGGIAFMHRFFSLGEQINIINEAKLHLFNKGYERDSFLLGATIGVKKYDLHNAISLVEKAGVDIILIDIAHGHCEMMKEMLQQLNEYKKIAPKKFNIIAGNVATKEASEDLVRWGADGVRVGIGGGCFTPDMLVKTNSGYKEIKDIRMGDIVITHQHREQPVMGLVSYPYKGAIYNVNSVKCTPNHLFYVINKEKYKKYGCENLEEHAEWIPAWKLHIVHNDYYLTSIYKDCIFGIEVKQISLYDGMVYDLMVDTDESYNVNDIIVHNSVCSTRVKSGVGVPMISSIMDCVSCGVPIMADGGIRFEGDVAKAIGAGANCVMVGSLLAGTDESPGSLIDLDYTMNSGKVKIYRGSASRESKLDRGEDKYVEGVSKQIPYKGSAKDIIYRIQDGLRSAMAYCGCDNIEEFRRKCVFNKITINGGVEAKPHLK